jgi:omega-6 fatty acid desaturase (delta-12 desaturase)
MVIMTKNKEKTNPKKWNGIILKYNKSSLSSSIWQLINSVGAYFLLWVVMVLAMKVSFWLVLPLIPLAAGLLIRVFIIFHDCGHGSFFKSKKLNVVVGKACGILAFTPYHKWTDKHRAHHQTVGNLDKRGQGDVWTLTVEEYQAQTPLKRFLYRIFRHPFFMIIIGGPLSFLVLHRFTSRGLTSKQKQNVYFTNVVLALLIGGMSWLIGWQTFLLIQLPVMYLAGVGGVYLFYLQHQYEDVIWSRTEEWDYHQMALHGSSFFKLPVLLRWFTGNIGYHHIHHLGPTIPNYNLVKCHDENPVFQQVKPITLLKSFGSLKLRLWDEKNQRIVSFRELRVEAD